MSYPAGSGAVPSPSRVFTLDALLETMEGAEAVRKGDLHWGDWVVVTTRNSVYTICVLGDDAYSVSGGWFDRQGCTPTRVGINGCTWGGSAIKHDLLAARGLFLEFANRVKTTRIQNLRVIRNGEEGPCS